MLSRARRPSPRRRPRRSAPRTSPRGHPRRSCSSSDRGAVPANSTSSRWTATLRRPSSESTTTSRPRRRIATRSATCSTSDSVCDERSTVRPSPATSRRSAWKLRWTSGSRPAIGSSRISSSGSCMKAWISPSFWRLPVESSRILRPSSASKRAARRVTDALVDAATKIGEVVEHRGAGQPGVEGEIAGQEPDPAPDREAVRAAVQPEQRGRPRGGLDQVEQQPHRRRLPGAVRAEEAEDLAAPDLEVELEQPVALAVVLRQTCCPDRRLDTHGVHGTLIRQG